MAPPPAFSDYLRELRQKKGYTQEQLAADLEVTRPYVTKLETGKEHNVSTALLDRMSTVLDVDRDLLYIMTGRWPPSLPQDYEVVQKLKALYGQN